MRDMRPFMPTGKTILVSSNATAPVGVQATPSSSSDLTCQFRVHNSSNSVMVTYAYGDSNTAAQSRAVVPTSTPQDAYPLPPGGIEVVTAPRASFWSAISASAVSVYITPGTGV